MAAAIAAHPGWAGGTDATVAAELANHWDAAGDAERALPAAVEAGYQAERGYAFAEAQRHLERALELWSDVPRATGLTGLDRIGLQERAAAAAHLAPTTRGRSGSCGRRSPRSTRPATRSGLGRSGSGSAAASG